MSTPTINGLLLASAAITIPAWGVWTADVEVTTGELLEGLVSLEVGGLTLSGTVIDGSPYREVGRYRIVGGAGGWRKRVPERAYRAEAGVKLATVLQDAARECGETMGTIAPRIIGPAFSRPAGEATRVLDLLSEESWYVDELGVTQVGTRASSVFAEEYTLLRQDALRRFITISAEDVSTLLPGATIEGLTVASVRHEVTSEGLRSHVWGSFEGGTDRLIGAFKSIVLGVLGRRTDYHRLCGYRVIKASTGYLDVQPLRATMGLPDLANVPTWGGMGAGGEPTIGSKVLVGFVDGDPCQPFVSHYEGEFGGAWKPQEARLDAQVLVKLGGGSQFVPLDNLLQAELSAIAAQLSSHNHTSAPPGDPTTASTASYSPGATAAAKVKAT